MSDLKRVVSAVKLQVDEFEFGLIPNSLVFKEGLPERTTKGLDNGDVTFSEDKETAVGMIKADVPSTIEFIDNAKTIGGRSGTTVKFFDDNGMERVMKTGVYKNDDEKSVGTDGKFTMTFDGTPLD